MILIADGGSTSVDWCLIDKENVIKAIRTDGINPFFKSYYDIYKVINKNILAELKDYEISTVHFFGAGCLSFDHKEIVRKAISDNFHNIKIVIESDLLGAAIGLCGDTAGIVGILGTGSNSCFFDGNKIVKHVPSLGYILGDEGSGAVLGRLFLNLCLKNQLTQGVREKFLEYSGYTVPEILDRVYNQQAPNTFLGMISVFISENITDLSIYNLVFNAFEDFFRKNIMQYDYKKYPVYITGSIASVFEDILRKAAIKLDIKIDKINQHPIDGLVAYFSKH
jgi:N-acetylglucosamine kinase-like BadF-type ATPase